MSNDEKLINEIREKVKNSKVDESSYLDRARSMDWRNPEEVKGYLDNLFVEYTFQCVNEKLPDGCHRLANYLENIKSNYVEATQLYKRNCDQYKYKHSCITYAKNVTLGRGSFSKFFFLFLFFWF